MSDRITADTFSFGVIPILAYAVFLTQACFFDVSFSPVSIVFVALFVFFTMLYLGYSTFKNLNLRRNYRLGLDGELYVGQELSCLMHQGYCVFHDFPADCFNIDHILVGPSGVYAVETKARQKPCTGNPSQDAAVSFNGHVLEFPKWKEIKPVDQAIRQAKWLANWLSSSVGEDISVRAILALPGWYVKRKSPDGIWVGNPKELRLSIPKQKHVLTQKQIKAICHQLEQKCRDVEPQITVYYS